MRKILVTSALPYANGSIHIGHLVEYIQTDIWVRCQKLLNNTCYFVCADDTHGTPIMLKAQELGINPEQLISQNSKEHQQDFKDFNIEFDNYYSTHSDENKEFSNQIYLKLKQKGFIVTKTISQAFDEEKQMFLPDRFIKGTCPKCKTEDQYGDNCENCGATYPSEDLINPVSALSGTTPITKDTQHYFFKLSEFSQILKKFLNGGHLQKEVSKKLLEWFELGLKDWNISRDAPYFGFKIPETKDKYFYVWLDAPIGYMASFKNLCDKNGLDFNEFWQKNNDCELIHFIGKDIIYFHGLFWPAVLTGSDYRTPTSIYAHGFLTVNGEKMSKSRGTFIKARTYLDYLNPEALRYYFAAKLSDGIEDIDLNFEDFRQRVNSDLVGKVINIASRCAGFINKKYDGMLAKNLTETELYQSFVNAQNEVFKLFETRKYNQAVRKINALADIANQYIDQQKPWLLVKDQQNRLLVQEVCTVGLNLFRVLITYLSPIIPKICENSKDFLQCDLSLEGLQKPLLNHKVNKFKPLMQRVEEENIAKMIEHAKDETKKLKPRDKNMTDEITIDDFAKLKMKVAKVLQVEEVEGSDKLLKLILDIGDKEVQIFSGIKDDYKIDDLVGKKVIALTNLKPRKMRFGISEGMILAAEDEKGCFLLTADYGAKSGMEVC